MAKMVISKIEKSYKFEGYCFITATGSHGKEYCYKRRAYERKTGKLAGRYLVNLNTEVYSFKYDPLTGKIGMDIKYIGSYKTADEAAKAVEESEVEVTEATEATEVTEEVQEAPEVEVIPEVKEVDPNAEVKHEKFATILACIGNNIPVYLAGPAGSGKNHTLEQVAKELGLDFYFTNSVQQEYKLTGFIDAGGVFHETEFYKAFLNGGLFFLDEMDASIPEVLVLLNAAIANGYFEFPNGKITAHKDFRVVAAGNTVGSGADEQYTGRMVLDQATLDRFVIIEFDYDKNIELKLAKGNKELVDFIRNLRTKATETGIRATFSYRCITMVTKLEPAMKLEELLKIAVVKGMDKDTIGTLKIWGHTKYHKALQNIQALA